mmetsp:Transcript_41726/g.73339  ORF Transcript_41726/g.73339 Transcript_41726/m.73339 type:complete len:98 (+) Transcript_41726:760-1053(+)
MDDVLPAAETTMRDACGTLLKPRCLHNDQPQPVKQRPAVGPGKSAYNPAALSPQVMQRAAADNHQRAAPSQQGCTGWGERTRGPSADAVQALLMLSV